MKACCDGRGTQSQTTKSERGGGDHETPSCSLLLAGRSRVVSSRLGGWPPVVVVSFGSDIGGIIRTSRTVALFGPWTVRGQFGIIFPILFIVTVLTTWSEGLVFVKLPLIHEHPIRNLFSETALYLVVAIVLAVLSRALKLAHDSGKTFPRRSLAKTAGILVICAVATLSLAP